MEDNAYLLTPSSERAAGCRRDAFLALNKQPGRGEMSEASSWIPRESVVAWIGKRGWRMIEFLRLRAKRKKEKIEKLPPFSFLRFAESKRRF